MIQEINAFIFDDKDVEINATLVELSKNLFYIIKKLTNNKPVEKGDRFQFRDNGNVLSVINVPKGEIIFTDGMHKVLRLNEVFLCINTSVVQIEIWDDVKMISPYNLFKDGEVKFFSDVLSSNTDFIEKAVEQYKSFEDLENKLNKGNVVSIKRKRITYE